MRQGLFAIVLVLAAFAGGALINGPGLELVRQSLRANPGSEASTDPYADGVEVSIVEGARGGSPKADAHPSAPASPLPVAERSPFAPMEPRGAAVDDQAAAIRAPRGPSIASAGVEIPPEPPGVSPEPPPTAPDAPEAPVSLFDAARSRMPRLAAPSKAAVPTAVADAETAPVPPSGTDFDETGGDYPDAPDSAAPAVAFLPGREPIGAVDPVEGIAPGLAPREDSMASRAVPIEVGQDAKVRLVAAGKTPAEAESWEEIRRSMTELGVGRYWVEGELGGTIRFRCVVPTAGERAVSQHFEAEGDDLAEAARDALRRIALWRAAGSLVE